MVFFECLLLLAPVKHLCNSAFLQFDSTKFLQFGATTHCMPLSPKVYQNIDDRSNSSSLNATFLNSRCEIKQLTGVKIVDDFIWISCAFVCQN